jgi:Domain of unknown function (DUF4292)
MKLAIYFFAMVWSLGFLTAHAQPISNEQLRWIKMVEDTRADTVSFSYLQISGDINIQLGGGNQSAQVVVRMKNDSCIWATVRVMGIEGIRAMITRDSVWVMDRLKRTYTVQPLSAFTKTLGIQVPLRTLQQQFLGKLTEIPTYLTFQNSEQKTDGLLSYQGIFQPAYGDTAWANKKINLIQNNQKQWQSLQVNQDSSLFSLNFSAYSPQMEGVFPRMIEARKMEIAEPLFQLSYSKIEFKNFETFPFKIPDSYLRVDEQ